MKNHFGKNPLQFKELSISPLVCVPLSGVPRDNQRELLLLILKIFCVVFKDYILALVF